MVDGLVTTVYNPASKAMLADLVAPKDRARAYALMRVAGNLGFAIGPALGGFLAAKSYLLLFLLSAVASLIFAVIVALRQPTKPDRKATPRQKIGSNTSGATASPTRSSATGPFLAFVGPPAAMLTVIFSQMDDHPARYQMKESFGWVNPNFGSIMTTQCRAGHLSSTASARWAERTVPGCTLMALGIGPFYGVGIEPRGSGQRSSSGSC